jgi:hypothetical protein
MLSYKIVQRVVWVTRVMVYIRCGFASRCGLLSDFGDKMRSVATREALL